MRPLGSVGCSEEENGSKRSVHDGDEDGVDAPPKKRNKSNEKDEGCSYSQRENIGDMGSNRKVGGSHEDEGGEAQVVAEARLARGQSRRSTNAVNWAELPTALFGIVLEWLSFTQGRRFFAYISVLGREKRVEYESQMLHKLVLPGTPPSSFLDTLENVVRLNIWSLLQ